MADELRKRNVFARHAGGGFYTQRLLDLGDRTVAEYIMPGHPDNVLALASSRASVLEHLLLLVSGLNLSRDTIVKRIEPRDPTATHEELAIGPAFHNLRARRKQIRHRLGIEIDARFSSRFAKYGFANVYRLCTADTDIGTRLATAARWLYTALRDDVLPAAIVQVAIALETMFVFGGSETLGRSLGERVAFLLAEDRETRAMVDSSVKRFYHVRSSVVHGGSRRVRRISAPLVDGMIRLAVLSFCVVGANVGIWKTTSDLQHWFSQERWGSPSAIKRPFGKAAVGRALALCSKDKGAK
jgi:hypothetical protein